MHFLHWVIIIIRPTILQTHAMRKVKLHGVYFCLCLSVRANMQRVGRVR